MILDKFTRWALLFAGAVLAFQAHTLTKPIYKIQAGLVGLLAIFVWSIMYKDHKAENKSQS